MVAAAGSGQRLGAGGPKAFVELAGRPMIEWSLAALERARSIGPIVIAAPDGYVRDAELAAGMAAPRAELIVLPGGLTRAESISLALERVDGELVAIHDAARPLIGPDLVDRVVGKLATAEADAVIAAAPIADTVKRARRSRGAVEAADVPVTVVETVDRAALWAAQTPQAFRVSALRRAQDAARERGDLDQATDEAWLIEKAGGDVLIEESPATNLKVTTSTDLAAAEALLVAR